MTRPGLAGCQFCRDREKGLALAPATAMWWFRVGKWDACGPCRLWLLRHSSLGQDSAAPGPVL